MTATTKHYVQFLSPGTFVSETRTKEIPAWDTAIAAEMANSVLERHNAKPYGFRFSTRLVHDPIPDGRGGTMEVEPKQIAESEIYFLGGVVKKYDDIPETKDTSILRSNMKGNGYPLVVENNNSWRFTTFFEDGHCIVGPSGEITVRGTDPELKEYADRMKAQWNAELQERMKQYA